MIPYEPHPVLLTIGPLAIHYYSLAYLFGFWLAYRSLSKRFSKEQAEDVLFWIVLATIAGGRLGYFLFYSPSTYLQDPLEVLRLWHGGMSFHGALIAIAIMLAFYCPRKRLAYGAVADALAIPAAAALGFGRIANWLNGELVGTLTSVPWCMNFPGYEGCRHPSQLYEALYSFALAGILLLFSRRKRAEGLRATLFILLYGLFRFVTTFARDDPRVFGLSEGQILSAIMVGIALYLLAAKYKSRPGKKFT